MRWPVLLSALTLVVGLPASSHAAGWFDDFNDGNAEDGNPVTWTYNELNLTPGEYVVVNGDYSLSTPGNGLKDDSTLASVNVTLGNTYVRTQAFIQPGALPDEVGGNVGVLARYNPDSISGYAVILDDGQQYALLRLTNGAPEAVLAGSDDIGIDAATDVMIELDVVGDLLSVYFWRPGEAKPSEPFVTATDDVYATGRAGILYNEDDDNTAGIFRFAAAQDTPFVETTPGDFDLDGDVDGADFLVGQRDGFNTLSLADFKANFGTGGGVTAIPEPATWLLVAIGGLAAVGYSRRRAHD